MSTDPDERFAFGNNWRHFLEVLDEGRIAAAQTALLEMLGVARLDGRSFLDAGSGSGLSSLAAMRAGAARVHSFDYDADSVASTRELKRRFFPDADHWTIEAGDVTDPEYVRGLGQYDVVYSWGVLHHTGQMWHALGQVAQAVAPGGRLFVAIYNDQGRMSTIWRHVKRLYNRLPPSLRPILVLAAGLYLELDDFYHSLSLRRPFAYFQQWRKRDRGMSRWHDLVDWVGGYPFEVATPDEIFGFYRERGFILDQLRTMGAGHGCNEFVWRRGDQLMPGAEDSSRQPESAPAPLA